MRGLRKYRAYRKFSRDKMAVVALGVIVVYVLVAALVRLGFFEAVGASHERPIVADKQAVAYYTPGSTQSWQHWLGTDRQGRSILVRALYSINVAISVGMVTALVAVLVGTLLGATAGYFGGRIDDLVVWLYSTIESIPYLLLLMVLSYSAGLYFGKGIITIYVAFCATFWTGVCRVIRGEAIRLRDAEFVQAAKALGIPAPLIVLRHIIPNTSHLAFVYFSLEFIGAIKSEVILSFLNLGVQKEASWGIMIEQARAELAVDFYWQIGAATAFMFLLVLAFNIFTDALQDALDPKSV
ncbi:MAG: ABC transporter permease [Candidatus Schekmanbacteria bacterium]|nr:ABC transporter permease [Candidatus Schekmanbacteria bacterium]